MVTSQKDLARLWSLAEKEAAKTNSAPEYVFDPIGLILVRPMRNMGYESTPINSATFAETGGDGVHFGFLQVSNTISEDSPVVMTVPMQCDNPNVVVGCNLLEFLCLGSQIGYFPLEQLAYDWRTTVEWIENPETYFEQGYGSEASDPYFVELLKKKKHLLSLLTEEFGLRPWVSVEQRLGEIQAQFTSLLQLRTLQ
jgi:hypothetical protein